MKHKTKKRKKGLPKALQAWSKHLTAVRKANPSLSMSAAMKKASKSFKKKK